MYFSFVSVQIEQLWKMFDRFHMSETSLFWAREVVKDLAEQGQKLYYFRLEEESRESLENIVIYHLSNAEGYPVIQLKWSQENGWGKMQVATGQIVKLLKKWG